jgi:hypothetical protein
MPLLPNALMSTARGNTANPIHSGLEVHVQPNVQSSYKVLPVAVMESDYEVTVDSGTDVVEGDIVTSITLPDGETPWPSLGAVNNNEYFRVAFAAESIPGPLQHRKVYVARVRGGGPSY